MPWSVKAGQLLRDQYAAVGAAARASLPAAVAVLGQAAATGLDVGDLLGRTRAREVNAAAFTDAYRRYCWPTDGLVGDRKSTRLNSSHSSISYAVFCLK